MSAGEQFFPQFRESQGGGWLISAGAHLVMHGEDVILKPLPYKRLTFAGGVVRRTFPVVTRADGTPSIYPDRCFSDDKVIP